jgi:putative flippase GtrA
LPEPRSEADYLVVGGIATLVAMGLLFAVLLTTWVRSPNVFFKRRPDDRDD